MPVLSALANSYISTNHLHSRLLHSTSLALPPRHLSFVSPLLSSIRPSSPRLCSLFSFFFPSTLLSSALTLPFYPSPVIPPPTFCCILPLSVHTSQGEVYAEGVESERNAGRVTNDLDITLEKKKGTGDRKFTCTFIGLSTP